MVWNLRVRLQIFNFHFLISFLLFTQLVGNEILLEYEAIKSDLKAESVTETKNFYFATSYSKNNTIEKNNFEKNKIKADSKLINHISSLIDWPKKIPPYLKKSLWQYYKSYKKYVLEELQIVDQGSIGEYYFVVVGIPKKELLKHKVEYNQIVKKIMKD